MRDNCKSGKLKSDVNLQHLSRIYNNQFNIPWPYVVHVDDRKLKQFYSQQRHPGGLETTPPADDETIVGEVNQLQHAKKKSTCEG